MAVTVKSRINGLVIPINNESRNIIYRYTDDQNALVFNPIGRAEYTKAKANGDKLMHVSTDKETNIERVEVKQGVNISDDDEVEVTPVKSAPAKTAPKKTPAKRQADDNDDIV